MGPARLHDRLTLLCAGPFREARQIMKKAGLRKEIRPLLPPWHIIGWRQPYRAARPVAGRFLAARRTGLLMWSSLAKAARQGRRRRVNGLRDGEAGLTPTVARPTSGKCRATKAVAAATLAALGDGSHIVPLDACIQTMRQIRPRHGRARQGNVAGQERQPAGVLIATAVPSGPGTVHWLAPASLTISRTNSSFSMTFGLRTKG